MTPPPCAPAEQWYDSRALDDGITHVWERFIRPFYRCNIWHVRGRDRNLLFDSGMGVVSLSAQLPWLREQPIVAVASHTHFDHVGSHHEFADRACHGAEAPLLAHPEPRGNLATRYARTEIFDRLPPGGFDPAAYGVEPAPATRLLEAGDVVDLGDRTFEVLHVPGHSPGSIALWEAATGVLLSGDTVYDGELVDDAYHSDIGDYVRSMERLRPLPVRVVHAGHYPSFGRERFVQLIDEYLAGRRAPGCPAGSPAPRGA